MKKLSRKALQGSSGIEPMNTYIHLLYVPTMACNMACKYCYLEEDTKDLGTEHGALETLAKETDGKTCGTTQELLEFPDTAARKRTDLTNLLAGLALLLFLFDVAQRRLDLFREPAEKDKTEETAKQVIKEKKQPKADKKKPESEGPSAADLLWQQMKDKKKL